MDENDELAAAAADDDDDDADDDEIESSKYSEFNELIRAVEGNSMAPTFGMDAFDFACADKPTKPAAAAAAATTLS